MALYTDVNCDLAAFELLRQQCAVEISADHRLLQDSGNPFYLPKSIFCNIFRLSQDMVLEIIDTIRAKDTSPDNTGVPIERQVLITLVVYANGEYQEWPAGWEKAPVESKATINDVIRRVTMAVSNHMLHYVKFPLMPTERNAAVKAFEKARNPFPGTLGVMDAFHVKIAEPAEQEWAFWTTRKFHSLNVQVICDADHKIIYVNPRYPGASRDNFVWLSSVAHTTMRLSYGEGERDVWLLGDLSYSVQPWLMTPVQAPLPGSPEARYNEAHTKAWSVVDECISALRGTWRLLSLHKAIDYEPVVVANMVNVCCILHNMRCAANVPLIKEEFFGQTRNKKKRKKSALSANSKTIKLDTSQIVPASPAADVVHAEPDAVRCIEEDVRMQTKDAHGEPDAVRKAEEGVRTQVQDGGEDSFTVHPGADGVPNTLSDVHSVDTRSTEEVPSLQGTEDPHSMAEAVRTGLEADLFRTESRDPETLRREPANTSFEAEAATPDQLTPVEKPLVGDDKNISKRRSELAIARRIRARLIARYFSNDVVRVDLNKKTN